MRRNAEDGSGVGVETARQDPTPRGEPPRRPSRQSHRRSRPRPAVETRPEEPIDDERRVVQVLTDRLRVAPAELPRSRRQACRAAPSWRARHRAAAMPPRPALQAAGARARSRRLAITQASPPFWPGPPTSTTRPRRSPNTSQIASVAPRPAFSIKHQADDAELIHGRAIDIARLLACKKPLHRLDYAFKPARAHPMLDGWTRRPPPSRLPR